MKDQRRHVVRSTVLASMFAVAGCASLPPAVDSAFSPLTVRVDAARGWTDTGLNVRAGDEFLFTATGEIEWRLKNPARSGPDGLNPWVGVKVGRGGLVGRVNATDKAFDIGARTTLFRKPNIHSNGFRPPPPIRMRTSGTLFLGFKDVSPGDGSGMYEVTVRRVRR